MNAESIAKALPRPRRIAGGWSACCPAHHDREPSLSITEKDGKVLFHCHAGCSQDAVLDALKARGVWQAPEPSNGYHEKKRANGKDHKPETALVHRQFGAPHAVYEYFDTANKLVGVVCRWDWPADPARAKPEPTKELRPAVPAGMGWVWEGLPEPRPLYRLPDILADPAKPVLLVEGEKKCDIAREFVDGYTVAAWSGGSSAIGKTDWAPLTGRDVVIWPDNDEAGRKAANEIATRLPKLRIVDVPTRLPPKWDLGNAIPDWLDVDLLIREAPSAAECAIASWDGESAAALAAMDLPPIKWAVPKLFPIGLILLAGRAKGGKTTLTRSCAVGIAGTGTVLGNIIVETGQVLYLSLEEGRSMFRPKLMHMLQGASAPADLEIFYDWPRLDAGGMDRLKFWAGARPRRRAVFVDIWTRFSPIGSKSRDDGRNAYEREYAAMMPLKQFAHEYGVAVFLIHHENKLGDISGTMAMQGAPDTLALWKRGKGEIRGTLALEGREIEAQDIVVEYDKETAALTNLGDNAGLAISDTRKAIIDAMQELGGPASSSDIALVTGHKNTAAIRQQLVRMSRTGDVRQVSRGKYEIGSANATD